MLIVTDETPYLSGFLAGVTVMTFMTMIYGLILDEGMRRYFVGSLTPSPWPDEPDAQSKEPSTYAAFQLMIGVGFVWFPPNPTPLPDENDDPSSGW
jgi:hypothetical protein